MTRGPAFDKMGTNPNLKSWEKQLLRDREKFVVRMTPWQIIRYKNIIFFLQR